ncbi:MAG: RHS repeat domain-containing protein, partial [Acidobacteriota bacterium]
MCPVRTTSGLLLYEYDGNGNVTKRTDARGVVTQFAYDELNRATRKMYTEPGVPSDQKTPNVTYCYDGLTAGGTDGVCTGSRAASVYGRLSETWTTASSTKQLGYDALGRVVLSRQTTDGQAYDFGTGTGNPGYQYNLADGLTMLKLPSGRTVLYGYDAATGQVSTIGRSDGTKWADQFSYAAGGALSGMRLGNGVVESWHYNSRLQPVSIAAGTLTLGYGYGTASANNGNVRSQTITAGSTTFTQSYDYDGLNRLTKAEETALAGQTGWLQEYVYDRYGNRAVYSAEGRYIPDPAGTPQVTTRTETAVATIFGNNQWSGAAYDGGTASAGNVTSIPGFTFTYDAESRLKTVVHGAATIEYRYGGDGRRVEKVQGTAKTVYVYDAAGNLAAEYATMPETGPCTTCYLTADHLGSTRAMTSQSGAAVALHDYLPFGEEIGAGVNGRGALYGAELPRLKFTSKERDAETGLDYFGA